MLNVFFFLIVLFGQVKQALELREHRVTHGPDTTLGPYRPYRDWPPKTSDDVVDQGIPGAPVREASNAEGGLVDPVTGEALAPLHHEGCPMTPPLIQPRSSRMNPNSLGNWHSGHLNFW
jgi:hypothetical protein